MKRKLLALCLAVSTLAALPSTALGYSMNSWGPPWNPITSYNYTTEVCVGASTGSTTWDTAGIPLHARAQNAMAQWNAISSAANAEFFLQVSNSCTTGDVYIIIEKGNYGSTGWKAQLDYVVSSVFCTVSGIEPWSQCSGPATLKINTYYPWWNQAGTPNPNQYDLYSAFTHELGHRLSAPDLAFGVHADCPTGNVTARSSMCDSFGLGSSWRRDPAVNDFNALNARY